MFKLLCDNFCDYFELFEFVKMYAPAICKSVYQNCETAAVSLCVFSPFAAAKTTKRKRSFVKLNNNNSVNSGSVISFGNRRSNRRVICCNSSFSFGSGSVDEGFSENDPDYVESSVLEAVEVRSGSDGFLIKMMDGRQLKCVHNKADGAPLLDSPPQHAIVLKMEDGSDLLLPMIVLELPSVMLMSEIHNIQMARPTVYHIVRDIIEKIGYKAKMVRVTHRVHDAYFAQLYLAKVGNDTQTVSFDLRPSDAINIAVRCKVPIQVNKHLAYCEGVKIINDPVKSFSRISTAEGLITEMDRPDGKPCIATEEFRLLRNMVTAALEERYDEAAQWRDQLKQMRSKTSDQTKQV